MLLDLVEGEKKWFSTPCVYTQNAQSFEENQIIDENQIEPNINTTPMSEVYQRWFIPEWVKHGFCS